MSEEIQNLHIKISELASLVGMLRGIIIRFESEFNEEQKRFLSGIDEKIEYLFY